MGFASLEISKSYLDVVLGSLLKVLLLEQGLDHMDLEFPSSFNHTVIL